MKPGIKHLFIINPRSFWHSWKMDAVLAKIRNFIEISPDCQKKRPEGDYEIVISQFPRDAIGLIRSCVKNLPEGTALRVYAVGGDGILFDCLNGIMGISNAALGAIPYGRTNNFIRGFGRGTKSLFRDLSLQCTAPTIPMDVIHAGTNYALNHCVVGIEAEASRQAMAICYWMEQGNSLSQWLSRKLYVSIYFIGGVAACLNKKLLNQRYEVTINEEVFNSHYREVSIFNSPYIGGCMHPINNALPNDGILDVILARSSGILRIHCLLPFYATGRHASFPRHFTLRRGRKITIRSELPLLISLDDAVFFDTELTVNLLPGAVQFIDPAGQEYRGISAHG